MLSLWHICKFRGKLSNNQTFNKPQQHRIKVQINFYSISCTTEEGPGGTYSWPSHSCAMASSGCRTCVRPERRTAPVPLSHRVASPSGFPSAWSSYISPLKERNKEKKLESCQVYATTHGSVTNQKKKKKYAYMACFHSEKIETGCVCIFTKFHFDSDNKP